MANGNLGHVEILQDELAKIRFAEAEEAASIIGARHFSINANDLYVTADDDALVNRLAKVIRETRPDVIITHAETDYMNDHVQACQALMRASFCASLPHWDLQAQEPPVDVGPVFHMDTVSGLNFTLLQQGARLPVRRAIRRGLPPQPELSAHARGAAFALARIPVRPVAARVFSSAANGMRPWESAVCGFPKALSLNQNCSPARWCGARWRNPRWPYKRQWSSLPAAHR